MIKLTKTEGGFLAASFAVIGIYLYTLSTYLLNIPLTDDYYDNFYFLYNFTQSDDLIEKIKLLFWQYDEKKFLLNRLVYLAYFYLFNETNFYYLSFIGNAFLIGFAFLLYKLYPSTDKSYRNLLIICLCTFNLSHHQSAFWTMSALSNYSAMVFALCCFYWLTKPQWAFFAASCLLSWFATFSMANGLLILPLGLICILLHNRPALPMAKLCIWLLSSTTCAFFYFYGHEQYDMHDLGYLAAEGEHPSLWSKLPAISLSVFALLGALPFNTSVGIGTAIFLGITLFVILSALIIQQRYFLNKQHTHIFIFLLFCLATIAVIALYRAPTQGVDTASVTSRYKNITSTILALTLLIWSNKQPDNKKCCTKTFAILIASVVFAFSYFKYLPEVKKWHDIKQNDMSKWAIHGARSSMGLSGWYYLSHEILSESVIHGIYHPFSNKTVDYQAKKISEVAHCPSPSDTTKIVFTGVTSESDAIGAKIAFNETSQKIVKLLLCSPTINYEITLNKNHHIDLTTNKMKVNINKSTLKPGLYSILVVDSLNHIALGNASLSIDLYQPIYTCDENLFEPLLFRKPMVTHICADYRKNH